MAFDQAQFDAWKSAPSKYPKYDSVPDPIYGTLGHYMETRTADQNSRLGLANVIKDTEWRRDPSVIAKNTSLQGSFDPSKNEMPISLIPQKAMNAAGATVDQLKASGGGWVNIGGFDENQNDSEGHHIGSPGNQTSNNVVWMDANGKYWKDPSETRSVDAGTHKVEDLSSVDNFTGQSVGQGTYHDEANTVNPWTPDPRLQKAWGEQGNTGPMMMSSAADIPALLNGYADKRGGVDAFAPETGITKIGAMLPGALAGAALLPLGSDIMSWINGGMTGGLGSVAGAGGGGATEAAEIGAGGPGLDTVAAGSGAPGAAGIFADMISSDPALAAALDAAAKGGIAGLTQSQVSELLNATKTLPGMAAVPDATILQKLGSSLTPGGSTLDLLKAIAPLATSALTGSSNTSAGSMAADTAANIAQDQWNYYKQNYQPLESNLINQAMDAGSPEAFARNRGTANADVTNAFDKAGKQTASRLQSFGINPSSPAYQSAMGSTDLAQGASTVGALTAADNNTRDRAYTMARDVVGIGRGIPAAATAGSLGASSAQNNASTIAANQNAQTQKNIGYGLDTLGNVASKWFGGGSNLAPGATSTGGFNMDYFMADGGLIETSDAMDPRAQEAYKRATGDDINAVGSTSRINQPAGSGQVSRSQQERAALEAEKQRKLQEYLKAHPEQRRQMGFADGGNVIEARKVGHGRYDANGLDNVLQNRGINPAMRNKVITPHMKRFAIGGGVGRDDLGTDDSNMGMPNDVSSNNQQIQGQGTATSDSIPAQIDGQEPAALSNGEFVLNAGVMELTGEEVAQAINEAGLKKRQQAGLDSAQPPTPMPQTSNDVSINAGTQAYRGGGRVQRYASCGIGA